MSTGAIQAAAWILLALWILLSELVIPAVVGMAQVGEGPALVQQVLGSYPNFYREFQLHWTGYSRTVTFLIAATIVALVILSRPRVRTVLDARFGPPLASSLEEATPRAKLVRLYIVCIVTGSVFASISGLELWPFAPYKMYAQLHTGWTSRWRLYGFAGSQEVDLGQIRELSPLDPARLYYAMEQARATRDDRASDDIARYIYARYEARRASGDSALPELEGVRIYRLTWRIQGKSTAGEPPDSVRLMHQWRAR